MKSFSIRWLIFLFSLLPGHAGLDAQQYHFRSYDVANGLPNNFVYSIREDERGFLWIGTGTELVRFDGRAFRKASLSDTLGQGFVTVSYQDTQGDLWFGFSNGWVGKLHQGDFTFYDIPQFSKSRINGIGMLPEGRIIVASQTGGLFLISPGEGGEGIKRIGGRVSQISALALSGNKLLIGTFEGLYTGIFDPEADTVKVLKKLDEIPPVKIQAFCETGDGLLAGTRGKGVWRLDPARGFAAGIPPLYREMAEMNITGLYRDSRGALWVSTLGNGLFRITKEGQIEDLNERGLTSRNIQCVFEDFEHNIWIGTYGQGLVFLPEESVVFYHFPSPVPGNNITALTNGGDQLVVAGDGGLLVKPCEVKGPERFYSQRQGLPKETITSVYMDKQGRIWAGTGGAGIFLVQGDKVTPLFRSGNQLENTINCITGNEKEVWAGTASGVLRFNSEGQLVRKYSTNEGLPYNNVNDIYLDKDGKVWLATMADGLYVIARDSISRVYRFPEMITRTQMKSITRDADGNVWIGSYGSGVIEVTRDTFYNYLDRSGLVSNYCYSLAAVPGSIWVGHSTGVSRIYPDKMKVRTYSEKHGISAECNTNAVCTDTKGRVWFGTTSGVICFDPANEKADSIPPKTNILSLVFSDKKLPVTDKIVLPYGRYRVRIDFLGISFRDPQEVTYQYKLENYDEGWSDLTTNGFAYYPRLEDGKYTFLLKAYNSSGYSTKEPVAIRIIIKKPFWKTWWFFVLAFLLLISTFLIILKVRERNHIRLEEYLKTELEKRTKEVIEKKEELEVKNKEITDSINYARRIQRNILPPLAKLHDVFPGSFVFYLPRDIVSGDFYWWGPVDEDRFLVVCADSTGHGVPGAFMSMIGSTLIKDLTNQGRYESPSQLLMFLDREIVMSLNQDRHGKSNDGMDITVLEINPSTRHIKFASAMRPVILFIDHELFYIRGNRSGVGGEFTGDKVFDDQEYDLGSGDTIYLFSDGYPDQFGGPKGKKMKVERVKVMLEEIHTLPMDEQYERVKNYFLEWKGDSFQVDDVLFMGLQL